VCLYFCYWLVSLAGVELLIRANMPTAGALRFYDKKRCNMKMMVKPYYESPIAFIFRQECQSNKKTLEEYLSTERESPTSLGMLSRMEVNCFIAEFTCRECIFVFNFSFIL
jgi:hypothetical protein